MKKKLLSLLLVAAMSASMCACTNNANGGGTTESTGESQSQVSSTQESGTVGGEETPAGIPAVAWANMEYDEASTFIYNNVLGEFQDLYANAADAKSVSESYALQALSEAKLLESAIMLPTTSRG